MLSANEAKDKKFETSAEEIMETASKAMAELIIKKPHLMLISEFISEAVAATIAKLTVNKLIEEEE